MYFFHSRMPQSGQMLSTSLMDGSAGVARIWPSSLEEGDALDLVERSRQCPASMVRTRFSVTASPSPRTMTSIQGASPRPA
jgi:hypothetical protein